jgi:pimeloyl-ACP methyl ester carboxylesterase
MPALAHLLGRMLEVLGIDQADILGYSRGGAPAQQFAHQAGDRVRSLVLVSTIYGVGGLPPFDVALGNMLTPKFDRSVHRCALPLREAAHSAADRWTAIRASALASGVYGRRPNVGMGSIDASSDGGVE